MTPRPPWVEEFTLLALAGDGQCYAIGDKHLKEPRDYEMVLDFACEVLGVDAEEFLEHLEDFLKRCTN